MAGFQATALGSVQGTAIRTSAYRSQAPGFDPTSGEGARLHGGRFNPPGSHPVLYLCTTRPCAIAALTYQAERQGLQPRDFFPRQLYRYDLDLDNVLDLTDDEILDQIGLRAGELVRPDHALTREVGEAAYQHRFQALQSRSATGVDLILAVFTENLGGERLRVELLETWTDEIPTSR